MKSVKQPEGQRRRALFGPGTIIALVVAVALLGSGWLRDRESPGVNAGQMVYKADAQGHLRQVAEPFEAQKAPAPPLWKPEVGLLLAHAATLKLDAGQTARLKRLSADWLREKRALLADMASATSGAQGSLTGGGSGKGASVTAIRQGLGEYSEISRQYDSRRAGYWAQATKLLTGVQREKLDALSQDTRGTR